MELSGLNKIFDTLGKALGVFDFSFFISGFISFSFLMVEVHHYKPDILYKLTRWETALAVVLVIYVCGLMSWAIGKGIRWAFLCVRHLSICGIKEDMRMVMQDTQKSLGITDSTDNCDTVYTKMWVELSKKEEGKERISFINQMWVKRAMFEGFITSWIVGLFVACDLECYKKLLNLSDDSCLPCILKLTMLLFAAVSVYMGTEYARNQIREVVVTHHLICK